MPITLSRYVMRRYEPLHLAHRYWITWQLHSNYRFWEVASEIAKILQGAYKVSEDFAKPYFHKYWTEIHDVTTIWKRNVCSFIVTLNAFDVRPTCDTADVQAVLTFPPNPLKHILCDVSHVGRTSNAVKVTMKLQTFLFQMVVTSCISVQYLWKYGFAKSYDNLYTSYILLIYKLSPISVCVRQHYYWPYRT